MKRIKHLFLSLGAMLGLTGCSASPSQVPIFAYAEDDTFISSLLVELDRELQGYDHPIHYSNRDQNQQNSAILEEIDNGADCLLVNLVDRLSASAIIEKAYEEQIPCIFLNRRPLDDDLDPPEGGLFGTWVRQHCFYVGSYPGYEGEKQAEIADTYFQAQGGFARSPIDRNGDGVVQVAIIKGEQGHQDAEERSSACLQGLKNRGYAVEAVASVYANWEKGKAKEMAASLPFEDIELVFSNNDDMALGVAEYLEENEPDLFLPIIGVDGTAAGKAAVEDGTLIGTVVNDAPKQAKIIAELVSHLLDGTPLPVGNESFLIESNYYYSMGNIVSSDF